MSAIKAIKEKIDKVAKITDHLDPEDKSRYTGRAFCQGWVSGFLTGTVDEHKDRVAGMKYIDEKFK